MDSNDRSRRLAQCRHEAGWAERTGHSVIQIVGTDRLDLLHRITTNDVRFVQSGSGRQTVLITEKARIIDVVTLLQDDEQTVLIGSRATATDILTWIRKYVIMDDVRLRDVTASNSIIEIMGPRSGDAVEALLQTPVSDMTMSQWRASATNESLRIVRMPSSCEISYWIIGSEDGIATIREHLLAHDDEIPHVDEDLDEYLRVLAGMGRSGHEWTLAYNPLEAGLLHLTSFTKGCYIGQEVIARLDSYNKVKQRVMGLQSPSPLHVGDAVLADSAIVGAITSVTASFDGSLYFGLGYVRGEHAHPATPVVIDHVGSQSQAMLVLPPMSDDTCR